MLQLRRSIAEHSHRADTHYRAAFDRQDPMTQVVTDSDLMQLCSVEACNGAQWRYGPYGSCSAQCGGGTATRTAICAAGDGLGAGDAAACNATGQPAPLQRACNPSACSLHTWTAGLWGPCDAPCGGRPTFLHQFGLLPLHLSAPRLYKLLSPCMTAMSMAGRVVLRSKFTSLVGMPSKKRNHFLDSCACICKWLYTEYHTH